jgi:hypothetical protein
VRALCDGATVPADFDERVREYSQQGFRLIAVAAQQLAISWEQVCVCVCVCVCGCGCVGARACISVYVPVFALFSLSSTSVSTP